MFNQELIDERVRKEATLIMCGYTLRQTSPMSGVSKSTVHHDMHMRLKYIDASMYEMVKNKLIENFNNRGHKGEPRTTNKYKYDN